jgi:hypothetical protein
LLRLRRSTGDRTVIGEISKCGNRNLLVLFAQAVWVVLIPKTGTAGNARDRRQYARIPANRTTRIKLACTRIHSRGNYVQTAT